MNRTARNILLAAVTGMLNFSAFAQTQPAAAKPADTPKGMGPYMMTVMQGEKTARTQVWLIRRSRDMVWISRKTQTGTYIDMGMSQNDIVKLEMPRPPAFAAAEQAADDTARRTAQRALHAVQQQLLPYRDLPGVVYDEALFLEGLLLEKLGRWDEALKLHNDILAQKYASPMTAQAKVHAGLCLLQKKDFEGALNHLDKASIPPEDIELLSEVCFGRGMAQQALEKYDLAIMDYLYPVVFHPFVNSNEVRCLKAVIPCYVARKDWDAVFKAFYALKKDYPDSAETLETRTYLEAYTNELGRELDFQIELKDEELDQEDEEEGNEDETEESA
ncbi:MAG: hypothetical protein AB7T27_00925 [Kiritimatiellia bacterium]